MDLKSARIPVADALEAIELFFERKWTDGLAIVPPTADRVEQFINYVKRDPSETLGEIPPKYGKATIEKLAVNSVMAGCRPEYFPVVIAAVEAMLEPEHNLNGAQTTTHNNEPLIIVNGPIAKELEINSGHSVFGRGYRANGTIGRAIRLILWNLGGNFPWTVDRSTYSHPGSWSYCIAENEEASPWEPFHVERGLPPGSNAVTVFGCEAPHSICGHGTSLEVLAGICNSMATMGSNNAYIAGQTLVTISARNAATFGKEGWSKRDVKEYIWEYARVPLGQLKKGGFYSHSATHPYWPKWVDRENDSQMVPLTCTPNDIHVIVAGGWGSFCTCHPGWGFWGGLAVTKEIKTPS